MGLSQSFLYNQLQRPVVDSSQQLFLTVPRLPPAPLKTLPRLPAASSSDSWRFQAFPTSCSVQWSFQPAALSYGSETAACPPQNPPTLPCSVQWPFQPDLSSHPLFLNATQSGAHMFFRNMSRLSHIHTRGANPKKRVGGTRALAHSICLNYANELHLLLEQQGCNGISNHLPMKCHLMRKLTRFFAKYLKASKT